MKNKNFKIILIGQIISLFGNAIQRFSMSLYLLELTGSAKIFSTILAISTIPYVLFAPLAGFLSDNFSRKKIMVYLDLFCSFIIGIYSIFIFNNIDNSIVVGVLMFILSICYTLYGPAVTSSIPQVVDKEELASANSIVNQVGSIVNLVGPVLAGILYGVLGIKFIVIINSISFLLSAILEMFIDMPEIKIKEKVKNPLLNSVREMKNSFIYLKNEKRIILGVIASYALFNIFIVPIFSIIAPFYINVHLGMSSDIYGIFEGISVLGMILAGIMINLNPKAFPMKKIHLTLYPIFISMIILTFTDFLPVERYYLVGIFALAGMIIMMSLGLSNIISLTFIQKEVREDMIGRVSAFSTAIATISVMPGQIIFGNIIEKNISLSIIYIALAIISLLVTYFVKWNIRSIK